MSTAVAERPKILGQWVQLDDDFAEALAEFEATANKRPREDRSEPEADFTVLAEPACGPDRADADFEAMMRAQEEPLISSPEDAKALRRLMQHPPPRRLPPPLPLDE